MTTRIGSQSPTPIHAHVSAPRSTASPARPFSQVLGAGGQAVVASAEAAVRQLPGGPVVAAAFRAPPSAGAPAEGPTPGAGAVGPGATGVGSVPGSANQALALGGDQTMYYLQLQQRISAENRSYTALSNVLKARHDTVKNAIGNIR